MSGKSSVLGAMLVTGDPQLREDARSRIQAAIDRAGGKLAEASCLLGVSMRTLQRWAAELDLTVYAGALRTGAKGGGRQGDAPAGEPLPAASEAGAGPLSYDYDRDG